jgi:hypothetical protein
MQKILKTTLTTAFAVACIAGASLAFAADNGGKNDNGDNGDKGTNATNNNMAGDKNSKSNKCADDANTTGANANCTTEPNAEQQ